MMITRWAFYSQGGSHSRFLLCLLQERAKVKKEAERARKDAEEAERKREEDVKRLEMERKAREAADKKRCELVRGAQGAVAIQGN